MIALLNRVHAAQTLLFYLKEEEMCRAEATETKDGFSRSMSTKGKAN